uniref:Ig-like domain-containing protein n=1 Tax=Maylandia zebra TaxID=106582 RepID=A0A3P9D9X8_9CICH
MASFLLLFPGLTAGDSITPQRDKVTATEGESVTLTCNYQTGYSNAWLHWYKHHSDLQAPQFILWKQGKGGSVGEGKNEAGDRFSSTLDSSIRSVPLKIQKLQLSDSAVYYCALQPTVTGNSKTLTGYKIWLFLSLHIVNSSSFKQRYVSPSTASKMHLNFL